MRFYTLYAIRYTLILAVLLIIPIGYTCAWDSTDNADRLSNGSSNVFSPGYLNAAKQHAYEVVNQINQPKSWWDNLVEAVKNKMSSEVEEQANTKVTPELKMKKSSGIGEHKKSVSITYETIVAEESNKIISEISYETINSLHYNVDIASGQNRHAETAANGQRYTVIEVGGVRHILAGFNGPDSQSSAVLQGAISIAGQNDIVLVRKGVYSGDDITITGDFSVPGINGIRILGGYDDTGNRDVLNNITRVNGSFNISNVTSKTEISGFTISENPGWWGLHSGIGISDSDTVTIDNNTFLCGGIWANNTPINLYDNAFKSGVYNDYRCGAVFRNLPDYPGLWMYPQIWDSVIKTRYTVSAVGNTFDNSTSFTVWGGYDVLSSNNRINGIYTSIGGTVKSVSGITGTVSMEVGRDPATTADPESYMEPTRLGSVVRIDDFTYEVILDNGQRTRVAVPTFNSSAVYSDAYNNVYNSSYQQKYREALAIAMQNASDNIPTDDYIVQQAQEYAARWVRDQAAQAVNALNSIYNDAYNNSMYTAQSIYNYDYAQQASDYDEAYRNYYASVYNDLYQNSFTAAYNEATGWGYDDSAALSYASAYAESQDYAGSSGYNLQSLSSDYAAQYVQARADEIQSMVDSYGRDAGYQALSDWANNLSMYSVSTYENLLDKNSLISAFASGESYDYLYSQIYDQLSSNGSVAEDAHNQGVSSAWNGYINGSVYNNYFYQGYMQSYDTGYANSYAERQVEQYAQSQAKSQAESYAASYAQSAVSTAQTSYKSQKQATINQKASEYLQQSKEQAKALSAEPVITNKISIISETTTVATPYMLKVDGYDSTADFMRQGLFSEGANNGLSLGPENLKDSIASSDTFGPEHLATGQLTDILYQNIGGANTGTIAPSSVFLNGSENRGDIMFALANILKNPTEDQKLILDAVESLLNDMKNLEEKAGTNPELNKAESDLLQMVASVLLAQGVPDLLKEGDIEGVKGIFRDLGASKDKIMLDYAQSIKPYYSNIVKELTTNLALLQLKGILSKKITEEELRSLEPKEIDKLLENIRRANDKSFELEYILQQDVKYRKEYLDPQNKMLEDNMKAMLNGFTRKINKVLEDKR